MRKYEVMSNWDGEQGTQRNEKDWTLGKLIRNKKKLAKFEWEQETAHEKCKITEGWVSCKSNVQIPYLAPETHLVKSMDPSWVTPAAFSSSPFESRSREMAKTIEKLLYNALLVCTNQMNQS